VANGKERTVVPKQLHNLSVLKRMRIVENHDYSVRILRVQIDLLRGLKRDRRVSSRTNTRVIVVNKIVLRAKAVQARNLLSIRGVRNDSTVLGRITPGWTRHKRFRNTILKTDLRFTQRM
jgi:hypothetical protein